MTEHLLLRASWLSLAVGVLAGAAHVLAGSTMAGSIIYAIAVLGVAVSTVLSATRHQLDRRILAGFLVIVVAIAVG